MRDPLPHVLVVDDDASIREALGAALGHTYAVHAAATGDEACAVLRRHPVAAIILDVVLGREQGLDLVARFRARSPAPILVLTGHVRFRCKRVLAAAFMLCHQSSGSFGTMMNLMHKLPSASRSV